jgi:hypothetical protein
MMDELVLHINWGGLGDHLYWSHIPRAAKKVGITRVLLANSSAWRHEDYRLIWTLNPYFDGFTDQPPTFEPRDFSLGHNINLLDRVMLDLGIDDGQRFHEPEFYYQPKMRPDWRGLTIFDPNFVSGVGTINTSRIRRFLASHFITVDAETQPRSSHYSLGTARTIDTPSLLDYADMIYSAGIFLCVTSGGATLAAALGKPAIVFFGQTQSNIYRHSPIHRYIMV